VKVLFCVLLLALGGEAFAKDPLPKGWKAEAALSTAHQWLADQLQQAEAQQEMNRVSSALAEVADAKLLIVYLRLYAALPPKKQEELRTEQTRWLATREKKTKAAYAESEGGSIAPLEANTANGECTEQRSATLTKRLTALVAP
jgi:uncharacterized protein YecT (DUF1311 family)